MSETETQLRNAIGEYDKIIVHIIQGVKATGLELHIVRSGESVAAGRLAALVKDRDALRELLCLHQDSLKP